MWHETTKYKNCLFVWSVSYYSLNKMNFKWDWKKFSNGKFSKSKNFQKIFNRNFRNDGEIKQKGIYIINVDVFKHPNEIMQFITDLKCKESNSICKYSGIRVRVFNWNIKLVMTVRTIRRADKVEGQNENEMLEEVDDDIRPRQKSTRKRTTAKLYILIQK